MEVLDIFLAQITDPFRIGLVIVLVMTAARTSSTVGTWIPLALGVVFVAVLIPTALQSESDDKARQIAIGLASNAAMLGVALAAKAVFEALARPKP
jgi:hypothetical protein